MYHGVDIGADHIGLDLVHLDRLGTVAVAERVKHARQLPGLGAVTQFGKGHGRPDASVGVLTTVFAHARHVALDIAGVQGGRVKRWLEQLNQPQVAAH